MIHDFLYKYFFSGTVAEGGSWGGAECASVVGFNSHILETIFWLIVGIIIWKELGLRAEYDRLISMAGKFYGNSSRKFGIFRLFEICLGGIEGFIWLLQLYYKINKCSICYIFQPCHIVLLIQSYALLSDNALSSVCSTLSLSMVTGTILAILVPDTTGLDQPYEAEMYWIQHYIIQLVPILLLLRNDGLMLKMTTLKSILLANWGVLILHWAFFEPMDVSFSVNVMFMLCPTASMTSTMSLFPSWLFFPSYRSTLTVALCLGSIPFSYCYVFPSYILYRLSGGGKLSKPKKV